MKIGKAVLADVAAPTELALNLRVGLVAGTAAGAAAAFVLVHDFHQQQGRAARVRRRH